MTLIEVVIAAVLLGVLASAVLGVILQTQAVQIGNQPGSLLPTSPRVRSTSWSLPLRRGALAIAAAGVVTNPHPEW